MQTTIGSDQPPPLARALDESALGRFVGAMEELGHRSDRAAMMGTFVGAVAGFPAQVPTATIPALQRYLPPQRRATTKQFRNLLNCEGWDPAELRRELVAAGVEGGVEAILVEGYDLTQNTQRPYDILSAHLLGPGYSVPVGWTRFALPEKPDGNGPDIAAGERGSAVGLLSQLREDFEILGLPMPKVPVVILDWRCGEDDLMRAQIAELDFELIVEVGDEYAGLDQTNDPLGPQTGRSMLFEQMPFAEDGSPSASRLLRTVGGRQEYVTGGLRKGGVRAYAISSPLIDAPPGSLKGSRARERANELSALASRISPSNAAIRLRVADLRSHDDRPWEAAAYLLSAFQATQMACFPKGGSL
ncbi:MAG: hypothetical protein WB507_00500 [Solirubrobacterales bacterium]